MMRTQFWANLCIRNGWYINIFNQIQCFSNQVRNVCHSKTSKSTFLLLGYLKDFLQCAKSGL